MIFSKTVSLSGSAALIKSKQTLRMRHITFCVSSESALLWIVKKGF
jgi:hypothetical protein